MEQRGNIPIFNIPGTLFRNIPRISLEIVCEYTGNISRECSTNISRTYICPVGNSLFRNVTAFVKSSMFDVWHGSISLQFLKNLKLNRLINIEYQHKLNSVTEGHALFINVKIMNMDYILYFMLELWSDTQTLDLTKIKVFHTPIHTSDL